MEITIRSLLHRMMTTKIIGAKHTPERKIIRPILWADNRKSLEKEYRQLIKEKIILRMKKRTGKDYDWHISINPRKIKEVNEILNEDKEWLK